MNSLKNRLQDWSLAQMETASDTENALHYWFAFVVCWLTKPAATETLPDEYGLLFPEDTHQDGEGE